MEVGDSVAHPLRRDDQGRVVRNSRRRAAWGRVINRSDNEKSGHVEALRSWQSRCGSVGETARDGAVNVQANLDWLVGLHDRPVRREPLRFDTVCDRLKELGFDGVELGAFPPHPNPGNPSGPDGQWPGAMPDRSQRQELRSRVEHAASRSAVSRRIFGARSSSTPMIRRSTFPSFGGIREFARISA